jgi:antirestriction protein ArdC
MKTDTYQIVTDRIIAKLQAGTIPWRHFASSPLAHPKNLVSKKPYRGINHFLLSGTKYHSEFWLTYNQAAELGGNVRKGEKAEIIVFWKFLAYEDKESGETKEFPMLRHYHVFNAEQCENIKYPVTDEATKRESNPIDAAEEIVDHMPNRPRIVIDQTPKAYYSSTEDFVHMTSREACISDERYYGTLLHELVHSSGHASRMNRFVEEGCTHHFGSNSYAKEELVAEMGSAMLCEEAGIFEQTEDDTAGYIANWLTQLANDNKLVVHAAGKAQKATDYILGNLAQPMAIAA